MAINPTFVVCAFFSPFLSFLSPPTLFSHYRHLGVRWPGWEPCQEGVPSPLGQGVVPAAQQQCVPPLPQHRWGAEDSPTSAPPQDSHLLHFQLSLFLTDLKASPKSSVTPSGTRDQESQGSSNDTCSHGQI